jgi:photosystem II stability/assembly factor-like uncharacterized protein
MKKMHWFMVVLIPSMAVDGATTEDIGGLHFRDGRRGALLAASGEALLTSDGGQLWTPASAHGTVHPAGIHRFSQVHFPDPDIGYALGNIVAKTVDGGSTWDSLGTNDLGAGVYFVDGDTGYVVGGIKGFCQGRQVYCTYDFSVYRKTTDGGKTWKSASLSSWPMLTVGCADARNCYSAGYDGKLFRINRLFIDTTVDVIANRLDSRLTGTTETLQAMDFPDPSTGYVVGSRGTILKSEDGGLSWRLLASGSTASLRAVAFLDARRGLVAGDSGTLLHTSDGGLSWALQPKLTDESLTSLECPSQDTCFAAGRRGTFLRLTDLPSSILRRAVRPTEAGRAGRLRWEIVPISRPAADLLGRRKQAQGRAPGITVLPAP